MDNEVDVVENGAVVKVFLLEAPLPWNAGDEILNAAGPFWEGYALTHAALGFIVEESKDKHILELYAHDYVGSFLPEVPPLPPTPTPSPSTASPTTASPVGTPPPTGIPPGRTPSPTAAPTIVETPSPSASGGGNGTFAPTGAGVNESRVSGDEWPHVEAADDRRQIQAEDVGAVFDVRLGGGVDGNGTAGELKWDNDVSLRPTNVFDPDAWATANYIGKITGLLYNDLTGWANVYMHDHSRYQPLSACGDDGGDFAIKGSADSYDFVWAAFDRLASNGFIFEQQIVLPPKRTAMCIFPEGGIYAVDYVKAKGNQEIEDYFRATGDCVRSLAAAAAAGNATYPGASCASSSSSSGDASDGDARGGDAWAAEGGVSVLLGLSNCLDGQKNAYLYHNETSYLRLPLSKKSKSLTGDVHAGTARLVRYAPTLPQPPPSPPGGPDRAYIVYIAVGVIVLGLAIAGLSALYRRRKQGNEGAPGGSGGSLFSSYGGWRGGLASDFGDFDSVGGGYEGALFPSDNYGSSGLSGSRSSLGGGGGRTGNRRAGPMEAETVQLNRPLLDETDEIAPARGESSERASSGSRRARGSGVAGRRDGGGRHSSDGDDRSPPPFSRIVGTMGGGPPLSDGGGVGRKGASGRSGDGEGRGRGTSDRDHSGGVGGGPLAEDGDDDGGDDPFAGGRGGESARKGGVLQDEEGGDEVFC